ncbi:MAG TPA: 7TM diverse intracellular signaling domain-containing protein, partial [Opitutus sp.]|nr:7TM diverse intracellular signaling domain-containing protein [Opitutus sp.]
MPRAALDREVPGMPSSPRYSRLLVTGMLALVMAFVGWLLFVVGGDRSGMVSLPDDGVATVAMLTDASRTLTADDIAAKPFDAWTIWDGEGYLHADGGVSLWVRVTLRNATDEPQRGVLGDTEYFSDRVELWERDASVAGGWRSSVSGEGVSAAEKPLWSRMSPFPVDLPARSERTFYFRMEDRFAVWARIAWWPRTTEYFSEQIRDAIAEAACYGALFGLLVYNTVFWVRLRDVGTGCYVLYASALTAANFLGNGGPALLGWPMGSPWKEACFVVALGGSAVFLVMFARTFLESEKRMPRADRMARRLRVVLLGFVGSTVLLPWFEGAEWFHYVVPVVALSHALMLSMGVIAWRQGVYHARYFVAASGAMLAGALPAVVQWIERDLSKSAAVAVLAGSVLEITLLAFAVAG